MKKIILLFVLMVCVNIFSVELELKGPTQVRDGEGFNVELHIYQINNLSAWEINFVFDPDAFQFLNVKFNGSLNSSHPLLSKDNLKSGRLMMGEFSWDTKGDGISGNFHLATIQLMKKGAKKGEIYIAKENLISLKVSSIKCDKKNSLTVLGIESNQQEEPAEEVTEIADSTNADSSENTDTATETETTTTTEQVTDSNNTQTEAPLNNPANVTNTQNTNVSNTTNANQQTVTNTTTNTTTANTTAQTQVNQGSQTTSNQQNYSIYQNINNQTTPTQTTATTNATTTTTTNVDNTTAIVSDQNQQTIVDNQQSQNTVQNNEVKTEPVKVTETKTQQEQTITTGTEKTESVTDVKLQEDTKTKEPEKKDDIPTPDTRCFINSLY